jgi:hypothetical protein
LTAPRPGQTQHPIRLPPTREPGTPQSPVDLREGRAGSPGVSGVDGWPAAAGNFNKMSAWPYAVRSIRVEGLHFHDLRHTGNTFAAASGAGLRDLRARMGHDSERAAMIYQHEARGADQAITSAIDSHVQAEQRANEDDDGRRARSPPWAHRHGRSTAAWKRELVALGRPALTCKEALGAVTRIELALSAWEAQRLPPPRELTRRFWRSPVTLVAPSSPWLMAR